MKLFLLGTFLIGLYFLISTAPLLFALIGTPIPGKGFWIEFSVALGFIGLAMMGLQFAVTARFTGMARPYGIDVILQFHKQISVVAFIFILSHPLILFITEPSHLELLNIFKAPWRAVAGVMSVLFLSMLIATSIWREKLGLNYEVWRIVHGIFGVLAICLALAHVVGVGRYVSLPWKQALWILMSLALVSILIYVRLVKPFKLLARPYMVDKVKEERGDSYTLTLRAVGHEGLQFQPGQFAWLTLQNSPFAIEEHPFSFSSSALKPERLDFTIKALGDFTKRTRKIPTGTLAYIDGPHGVFTSDREEGPGFVFIAGGIGITPIMSMLNTFVDREDVRPIILIYGSKKWEDVTFREEIEAIKEKLNLKVVHVLEEPPQDWTGHSGFITEDLLAEHLPEEKLRYEYFVCGPEKMMEVTLEALRAEGVSLENINMEKFNLV